jgi:hypothetical protein
LVLARQLHHILIQQRPFSYGLTNEDAQHFGKLSKTSTWEALLELYFVDGETLDTMLDSLRFDPVDPKNLP